MQNPTPDSLLSHITLEVNTNDILEVDCTNTDTNYHVLEAVSPISCDNAILNYNIPLPGNNVPLDNYLKEHPPAIIRLARGYSLW